MGNQKKEEQGKITGRSKGSQKKVDKVNRRVETDVDDKLNPINFKKSKVKAISKAMGKMKDC